MTTQAGGSVALPLDNEQTKRVQHAISDLSREQLHWVSGYVAGLAEARAVVPVPAAEPDSALTILYGSQTGNGQGIAESLAQMARDKGFAVRLDSLAHYKPANLKREALLALVISTHGEGEPPDDAELFHEFLLSAKAPSLGGLSYSVLALGDSSYANYCQTGRELDARLGQLGAVQLSGLVECDLDYEDIAGAWSADLVAELPKLLRADVPVPLLRAVETVPKYDRHRPFAAEVLVNQKITGAGSSKDVRHVELSLEGSGISYEPGDALAVVAVNPPQLISQLIELLGLDADEVVSVNQKDTPLGKALRSELEITVPSLGFLKAWAEHSASAHLTQLLQPGEKNALSALIGSHQIIDIVRAYPARIGARDFVQSLRKLTPRSYSIASSLRANPDEVHLTVAAVRYDAFGSEHWGAASTHIAYDIAQGDTLSVFIEPNPRFHLPADDKPIIMIGPGTGVAPFRAFVEERAERGARGKNWLFFGDRSFSNDFLYQLEWQRHLQLGNLQRMDVAFSRDQDAKVYVQHRMLERGMELYQWLTEGAVVYVCGDAKHMAGDVHDALIAVLVKHGGRAAEEAEAELKEMRRSGRYQRDVY